MIPLLTRQEVRSVDARLVRDGVPSVLLMENAGRGAAEVIAARARSLGLKRATVLVGPGNNGGDGLVVARQLALRLPLLEVTVACVVEPGTLTGDAAVMRDVWWAMGGAIGVVADTPEDVNAVLAGRDLVIDGLFGTGLSRALAGPALALVRHANTSPARLTVALDIPSGLDADTGSPLGDDADVFHAQLTCTFAASKPGLHTGAGRVCAGEVVVIDLGVPVPRDLVEGAEVVLSRHVRALPRRVDAHKGTGGRVLVVGGSEGRTGAALLTARGAHRGGAGLVTIASRAASSLDARVLETMTAALPEDVADLDDTLASLVSGMDAVVVGPGLGLDGWAHAAFEAVWRHARGQLVVDADALTLLAGRPERDRARAEHVMLTPHPMEMARLLGLPGVEAVQKDRFACARDAARRYEATVVLKGAGTLVVAPQGVVSVMPYAEPTLAVAGSGDVLSGVIAARVAERNELARVRYASVVEAVHAHGLAGERVRETRGAVRGALASEIADAVSSMLERG